MFGVFVFNWFITLMEPVMFITLSEAAALCERKHGKKVHKTTVKSWGKMQRFQLHYINGWKVDETEFTAWAAKTGRLKQSLLKKAVGVVR